MLVFDVRNFPISPMGGSIRPIHFQAASNLTAKVGSNRDYSQVIASNRHWQYK